VSPPGGGFQAFLRERFWPEEPEMKTLVSTSQYLRALGKEDAAGDIDRILDAMVRLGRPPLDWVAFEGPIEGKGDPRESRGDWPPEEDCPYCPSGRKEDPDSPHKMSCSWMKGHTGRMTIPVVMGDPIIVSEMEGGE